MWYLLVDDKLSILFLQTVEVLEELVEKGSENMNVRNKDEVMSRIRSSVASKQFGQEDILCPLIADVNICFLLFYAILTLNLCIYGRQRVFLEGLHTFEIYCLTCENYFL